MGVVVVVVCGRQQIEGHRDTCGGVVVRHHLTASIFHLTAIDHRLHDKHANNDRGYREQHTTDESHDAEGPA